MTLRFINTTRLKEKASTYRIIVSPALVPICADGGMDARKSLAAYSNKREWYGDQMMVTEGLVISMGPLCGMHERMGNKPPCKIGDIIRYKQYAGQFTMLMPSHDEESKHDEFVQYINDQDILGVQDSAKYKMIDPSSIYINGMYE